MVFSVFDNETGRQREFVGESMHIVLARIALVAVLFACTASAHAAPQRIQEIHPSADSGLPGYVAGIAAMADGTLYTVDARNGLLGSYQDGQIGKLPLTGADAPFGSKRLGGIAVAGDGQLLVTAAGDSRAALIRPDGTILAVFGASGGDAGELSHPRGVAVSVNGRVYVADRGNGRISVFSRDGVFLHHVGGATLKRPEAVGVNAAEHLFVLDRDRDGSVVEFDADGDEIARWSADDLANGNDLELSTLALGPDNVLYVADAEHGRVFVLDREPGRLVEGFGSAGAGPGRFDRISALAGLDGGRVAVADSGNGKIEIYRVAVNPQPVKRIWLDTVELAGGQEFPCERMQRVSGDEFLCLLEDEEAVALRNGAGEELARYSTPDMDEPQAAAADERNVVVLHGRYMSVFSRAGEHISTLGGTGDGGGTFRSPVDVSLRGERIYVADSSLRQIQMFSREGVFLQDIRNPEYRDSTLKDPVGVVADSQGIIYVADRGRSDVAVFDAGGELLYRLGTRDGDSGVTFQDVRDIEMDPDGQLYVLAAVEGADARIVVFNGPRAVFAFGAARGGPGALEDPRRFAVGTWPGTGITVQDEDRVVDYRYLQVPGRVTEVDVSGDSGTVRLSWTPVPGRYVTHYRIHEAPAGSDTFTASRQSDEAGVTFTRASPVRRYRVAAVSGFGREGPHSPIAEDRLGMAMAALEGGDAARAEDLLRAVHADRPRHPAVLEWLGRALLARGDAIAAAGYFRRLAAVADDRSAALRLQIEALADGGEFAAAQAAIREVIEAGEADARTYLRCGEVALELDDAIGAVDCLDRIADATAERTEASFLLARAYVRLDLPDEAMAVLEKGVSLAGGAAEAHARTGHVLREMGRNEAALDHFRKALDGGIGDARLRLAHARTALALEQYDEVNHVAVELAGNPDTEAQGRYLRGLVAQARDDQARALIELGRATRTQADFVEAWLALADTYRAMERPEDERQALQSAWEADNDSFDAAVRHGRVLRDAGRHKDAVNSLARAHRLRPQDALVARELADSLLHAERLQNARNAAEDALEAAAGDAEAQDEARILLARISHGLGRTARAVELVQNVLERRPDDAGLYQLLGRIYLDSNVHDRAGEALQRAQSLAPDSAEPYRLLGDVHLERRQFDQAIAAYERALDLEASSRNRAALETAFAEKKRSLEFGANRPRIVLRDLRFEPVFAAAYKQYTDESFGSVTVANVGEAEYGNLKLTFRVKGYMDFETQHEIDVLPAGSEQRIPLTAAFNNRILEIDEDTGVQSEVALEYTVGGKSDSIRVTQPLTVYGKNAILWGRDRMVGAFVTPRDDILRDFVRRSINEFRPESGLLNERLVTAMTLFNTLSAHGMKYVIDPNSPFSQVRADRVDYVQFPRESLHLKTGDCDDLSVLLAAGLQNLGIETAVVGIPGHLFMMFNTGLPESDRGLVSADESLTVVREGQVWIPLEATMIGESFSEAWVEGARKYQRHAGSEEIEIVALENAWEEHAPVTLPPTDSRPEIPRMTAVGPRIERERTLLLEKSIERLTRPYRAMLAANPENDRARMQIALLQGRYGLHEQALDGFAELLAENPGDSAAFNNRGNVYLIQGNLDQALETYRQAEALAPNDPGIKINLAMTHYHAGELERARDKLAEAQRIDREIPERYQRLVQVLSD